MTDTVTPSPTVSVGQTWRYDYHATLRNLVLAVVDIEGTTWVAWRPAESADSRTAWRTLDEFLEHHDEPEWPVPEPHRHYAAVYMDDGRLDFGKPHSSAKAAHEHADAGAVGVVKVTTTYEWVDADETGGE